MIADFIGLFKTIDYWSIGLVVIVTRIASHCYRWYYWSRILWTLWSQLSLLFFDQGGSVPLLSYHIVSYQFIPDPYLTIGSMVSFASSSIGLVAPPSWYLQHNQSTPRRPDTTTLPRLMGYESCQKGVFASACSSACISSYLIWTIYPWKMHPSQWLGLGSSLLPHHHGAFVAFVPQIWIWFIDEVTTR